MSNGDQKYWATLMVTAGPVWFLAWGAVALFALTHGGRQAGIVLGLVWLFFAVPAVRQPYVAILRSDGSISFKAVTRTLTTPVDAIYRISILRGRGRLYVFHFDDRKAALGLFGGQELSRYLLERDPTIQHE